MNDKVEQAIKDRSEVAKQIMRDIDSLCEMMTEAGQGDSVGITSSGWEYSFKAPTKAPEEDYF